MHDPIQPLTVPSAGVTRIAQERTRQVRVEGYSPADDLGKSSALFTAAAEYAHLASLQAAGLTAADDDPVVPFAWPFEAGYWKPAADPIRNAEKAGALLAAAIDALLAEQGTTPTERN